MIQSMKTSINSFTPNYVDRFLIFLLSLLFLSCQNREEIIEQLPGGAYSRVFKVNGLRQGKLEIFSNSSGKLLAFNTYTNDSLTGPYEIYFPSGELAEKGNMYNGLRAGLLLQFYQNGRVSLNQYIINVRGEPIRYYTIKYDSLGKEISTKRDIVIDCQSMEGHRILMDVMVLDTIPYDSMKIFFGYFNFDFSHVVKLDSTKLESNHTKVLFERVLGQEYLRGYLMRYRTVNTPDSIVSYRKFGYFEERLPELPPGFGSK